ncbi:alkanesulfonate monooxygenase [Seinonella peptonophila]|uniref:Alkanesulfonate monooxygenase n=1 Tax=Seinonella peptonophila TaxID=112248 RepID=A0A1M5BMB7_9BACL|nr:LLM class flavin-dependent oxidoreductase [Seinonella peptonophila]SHF43362.1 alkanesulfonate monooxygenase [Seinonella peptonophila]
MEIIYWLPTLGDQQYFGADKKKLCTDHSYLKQVAQTIDSLGYDGMYLGTGSYCEDPWIMAASLIDATKQANFLIALRPSIISPTAAARMATTFDRVSNGRIALNIVSGAAPAELASDGVFMAHDQRHEYTDEFLTVYRQLMVGETVSYHGKYLNTDSSRLLFEPKQKPYPPIYCVGSSEIGQSVAAKHADVYLMFGEPLKETAEIFASVRKKAQAYNRSIRFAIGLYIIVREQEEEAWQAANEMIQHIKQDEIDQFHHLLRTRFDSQGRERQTRIIEANASLKIDEHLWAGTSLVNIGPFAVVGNPDSVVKCIQDYMSLGADIFAIAGIPHLEEAYRISDLILPRLRKISKETA